MSSFSIDLSPGPLSEGEGECPAPSGTLSEGEGEFPLPFGAMPET